MFYIKIATGEVLSIFKLREMHASTVLPNDIDPSWLHDNGYAVFHTPHPPEIEIWETYEDAGHEVVDGNCQRKYLVRNKTQLEIDELNNGRLAEAKSQRARRYRTEADPLFFQSERGESTREEWLAKVAQIKSETADPELIYVGGKEGA